MIQKEKTIFLADMHLRPANTRNSELRRQAELDNKRLLRFSNEIMPSATRLVLLGDAFHCWFERRGRVVGDFTHALSIFGKIADSGITIHHICGNRDFAVGEGSGIDPTRCFHGFLRITRGYTVSVLADYGIEPYGMRFRFGQQGKVVSCIHGDSLCRREYLFHFSKWLLQGAIGRNIMRFAPWFVMNKAVALAQNRPVSMNRAKRRNPAERINLEIAKKEIALGGANLIVCGHIHDYFQAEIEFADRKATLFAIPAWLDGYYAVLEDNELRVEKFN